MLPSVVMTPLPRSSGQHRVRESIICTKPGSPKRTEASGRPSGSAEATTIRVCLAMNAAIRGVNESSICSR